MLIQKLYTTIYDKLQKRLTRKKFFLVLKSILVILLITTLGKWLCYEYFTGVSDLRKNLGKRVVYNVDDKTQIEGILSECKYKFNDCFGFFDISITITGIKKIDVPYQVFETKVQYTCSLSVVDIKKIKFQYEHVPLPNDCSILENKKRKPRPDLIDINLYDI
jgi:hypothetical protein